jgi:signal peptidase II
MAKGGEGQWRWLWLTFAVIVIDLGSKSVASFYLNSLSSMQITPFLNLVLVHNTGSAFGFLANQNGWQLWLFVAIALAVSIGILALF